MPTQPGRLKVQEVMVMSSLDLIMTMADNVLGAFLNARCVSANSQQLSKDSACASRWPRCFQKISGGLELGCRPMGTK